MKSTLGLIFLLLFSCHTKPENKIVSENSITDNKSVSEDNPTKLFLLHIKTEENLVRIEPPKGSDFSLPDSSVKNQLFKWEDFNADNKEDIMVYMGACGTGGCVYAVFLNEYDDYYSLAFMDYLKGVEFKKEKNGLTSIKSYEEMEAYNPSKLYVRTYTLDNVNRQYELDTTFVYIDK